MSEELSLPTPDLAPRREMLIELVDLHARSLLRMPWIQTVLVLGIGLVLFEFVRPGKFIAWGACSIAIEVLRARYAAYIIKQGYDVEPRTTHALFVGLATLAGASIGAGAFLFMPQLPLLAQALFGAILIAVPSAGVAVSQSSRFMVAGYAGSILLPAAVMWGVLHTSQLLAVAALGTLEWFVLVLVAADGDKLLLRSVMIRHERDRLVLDLEQRNADVRIAMAQAEQSAQARARVLAAASHDLRQPLHALSVYSAVLAAHPAPDTLSEVSHNIDQIVRTLGSLLNGLLDLSRLSAGYYVPEQQPMAVEKVIADVCAEYERAVAQKGLRLEQDVVPMRILGDAMALGRIVRNLLDNAVKYTEAGYVSVSARLDGTTSAQICVLRVSDSGKGIPPAEQGRIFEEFYQLDNPGRDRSRGVGLGLAIVQRLTELVGAVVQVESTLGVGTTFQVSMPVTLVAAGQGAAQHATPVMASLKGKRIYVVDDERDILKSMHSLLSVWGIDVKTAESPSAAQALFDAHGAPDMMVVDLRLGDTDHGSHLSDRLQRKFGDFPVLIITGETASDALRDAHARGFTVLQKPIAPEVLRQSMAAAIVPQLSDSRRP